MNAGAPHQHGANQAEQPQAPVPGRIAAGAAQQPARGQQQANDQRCHALLEGAHAAFVAIALAPAGGLPRQQGAGQQNAHHACGNAQRTQRPGHGAAAAASVQAHIPAQQGDKKHVRAGRSLGNGDGAGELGISQPVLAVHQKAVHIGRGGNGAAHGHQGQGKKVGKQVQPVQGLQINQQRVHAASLR